MSMLNAYIVIWISSQRIYSIWYAICYMVKCNSLFLINVQETLQIQLKYFNWKTILLPCFNLQWVDPFVTTIFSNSNILLYSISPSTNLHPNLIVKILWLWLGQIHSMTNTSERSINYGYSTFPCGSVAQLTHVKLNINRRRY